MAREDAREAIEIARSQGDVRPVVTIADGADHTAQTAGFHKRWWRQLDEGWPASLRAAYNETFTGELTAARVAVVELHFDAAAGRWSNVGVVDLERWEPTFPYDPATGGWVRQDARSRVGWRRRSALRNLFSRRRGKQQQQQQTADDGPAP